MKLTNKHNIPPALFQVIQKQIYEPNPKVMRVTELINPPLIKNLSLKHWSEIEVDASDFLTTLLGTAGHYILSQCDEGNVATEPRLEIPIPGTDWTMKGQPDRVDKDRKKLVDYKFVSVFSYIFGQERGFEEYAAQLNMYLFMLEYLRRQGADFPEIESAELNLILRDWSKSKVGDQGYPPIPFVRVPLPIWGFQKQAEYLNRRIHVHQSQPFDECSPEEKWQRETTYAVMEKGRKSALAATYYEDGDRVPITTRAKAEQIIKERKLTTKQKNGKVYIEERPGKCVRCADWCLVRSVCPFAKGQ